MSADSAPTTIEAAHDDSAALACLDQHCGLLLGVVAGAEGSFEGTPEASVSPLVGELSGRPSPAG